MNEVNIDSISEAIHTDISEQLIHIITCFGWNLFEEYSHFLCILHSFLQRTFRSCWCLEECSRRTSRAHTSVSTSRSSFISLLFPARAIIQFLSPRRCSSVIHDLAPSNDSWKLLRSFRRAIAVNLIQEAKLTLLVMSYTTTAAPAPR